MFGLTQNDKNKKLAHALRKGRVEAAARWLEKGADPNGTIEGMTLPGWTIRHAPVSAEKQLLDLLLNHGAEVEAKDNSGMTALGLAAASGRSGLVERLLEAGADPLVRCGGTTPLALAICGYNWPTAEILISYGGLDKTANDIQSLFDNAVNRNAPATLISKLLEAGADIDQANENGVTPLNLAVGRGATSTVQLILQAAQAQNRRLELNKPLATAVTSCYMTEAELLIKAGADVNAVDDKGVTPLMKAAAHGQVDMLKALIKAGAKYDAVDKDGDTALGHAETNSKSEAKFFLRELKAKAEEKPPPPQTVTEDQRYVPLSCDSLEIREGGGLSTVFNFKMQQVIYRDTEHAVPMAVQNFSDIQRQEVITEAYDKLVSLGGTPPEPGTVSLSKKRPGLASK